jgi:hypothetical protein
MQIIAKSPDDYIELIPADRKPAMNRLRQTILANLPKGFVEEMSYGMIGYVVPLALYPAGYHCDTKLPLPFMAIASQKNFIALYHMAIYADKSLHDWFTAEFLKHSKSKLDMGKSCTRFKKPDEIPFSLIGQLAQKISVEKWVEMYEAAFKKPK